MSASRHETKLKALRAAAGVALFTGAIGCGTAGTDRLDAPVTIRDGGSEVTLVRDAGHRDSGPRDGGVLDTGVLADAGFVDASVELCDMATMTQEEYFACCDANGWDFTKGCAAWGPPAPPAMEIA